jgi:hypothetical protein
MAKMTSTLLGFPIPDKIAKDVETALNAVPKDLGDKLKTTIEGSDGKKTEVHGYARRFVTGKGMEVVDGERCDVSVITSDSVDRDGEVVLPSGLDFSQFQRNPVVTLCHDYKSLPIGKCLWVKKANMPAGGDCWKAKTQYMARPSDHPEGDEWVPDTVWAYVRDGYMPGKSIGFIPLSYRDITPDDVRANPDYADAHWMIDKAMVLEYSACPVQSNPDALVEAVGKMRAKGIDSMVIANAIGLIIPDDVKLAVVDKPKQKDEDAAVAKATQAGSMHIDELRPEPVPAIITAEAIKSYNDHILKECLEESRLGDRIKRQIKGAFEDALAKAMGRV